MVNLLHRSDFQTLCSFVTILHSTWHKSICNEPPEQANDIEVMGLSVKHMTFTKVFMESFECFPRSSSQDKGRHLQEHRECLQDCLEAIQSIGQLLPAPILHLNLLAQRGEIPLASQQNCFSCLWNRRKQMMQESRTCHYCRRLPMTIMMQTMTVTIRRSWEAQRVNPLLAWSKQNSPLRNLPTGWGRPTIVYATNGRKYGWHGFSRKSIGPLCGARTISNN